MNYKEQVEAAKTAAVAGKSTPAKKTKSEEMGEKLGLKIKAWSEEAGRKEAERKAARITPQQKRDYANEQIGGVLILVLFVFCGVWIVGRMFTPQSCSEYTSRMNDTLGATIDSRDEVGYAARGIQGRPECF